MGKGNKPLAPGKLERGGEKPTLETKVGTTNRGLGNGMTKKGGGSGTLNRGWHIGDEEQRRQP